MKVAVIASISCDPDNDNRNTAFFYDTAKVMPNRLSKRIIRNTLKMISHIVIQRTICNVSEKYAKLQINIVLKNNTN